MPEKNIYHRYLNLPFKYPKPDRFNRPSDNYAELMDSKEIYKPFKIWLEQFNLTISNVFEAFYTKPNGGTVPLHADTGFDPGTDDVCKLNFTWGSSDSTTRWYRAKDKSMLIKHYFDKDDFINKKFYDAGIEPDIDISHILTAAWDDVDLVYEAVIDKPSLLNISQLHSTWNPSPTEDRWSLCFTLLENGKALRFNRALEIFNEYILTEGTDEV